MNDFQVRIPVYGPAVSRTGKKQQLLFVWGNGEMFSLEMEIKEVSKKDVERIQRMLQTARRLRPDLRTQGENEKNKTRARNLSAGRDIS